MTRPLIATVTAVALTTAPVAGTLALTFTAPPAAAQGKSEERGNKGGNSEKNGGNKDNRGSKDGGNRNASNRNGNGSGLLRALGLPPNRTPAASRRMPPTPPTAGWGA